jgi:hypothetical protein
MRISFRTSCTLPFLVAINFIAYGFLIDSEYDPFFKLLCIAIALVSLIILGYSLHADGATADPMFKQVKAMLHFEGNPERSNFHVPQPVIAGDGTAEFRQTPLHHYTPLLAGTDDPPDLENPLNPKSGEVWRRLTSGKHYWVLFLANEHETFQPVHVVFRGSEGALNSVPLAQWQGRYIRVLK